jgi:hypothetical protein
MPPQNDPLSYFRLKLIQVARVSEISETTSAAPVPSEDKVNFHIGNPLQDTRLSSAFLRIALGIDVQREDLTDAEPEALLENLGWEAHEKSKLDFLIRVIQKSSPYYRVAVFRKNPHSLIRRFSAWLEQDRSLCIMIPAKNPAGGRLSLPRAG